MLCLSRLPGESINIGDDIVVEVRSIRGNRVQLAIHAPLEMRIMRAELIDHKRREPQEGRDE